MIYDIYMKKYLITNSTIYYKVQDFFNNLDFYVGINTNANELYFYTTSEFKKPLKVVNFSDPNKVMGNFPNIPKYISNWVIAKIYEAVEKGKLPDCISRQS